MKIDLSTIKNDLLTSGMKLASAIESKGYEAYLVGGCVRDMVRWSLGQSGFPDIHDIDISTNMPIEELQKTFKTASNNGEAHGTILVFQDGEPFEVTQFRTDGAYTDGRHPDSITFAKTFKEDCLRRDFTINAMGLSGKGEVIDYYGGIADVENGIIRAVGKAEDRFAEDYLRIFRGVRFMVNFDYSLADSTYEAMKTTASTYTYKLDSLSYPRIRGEISKVKNPSKNLAKFFFTLNHTGVLNWLTTFRNVDVPAMIKRLESVKHLNEDNIFAVIAFGEEPEMLERLSATREDSRLLKWYNYMLKKLKETNENISWDSIVKFVEGDYKTLLEMTKIIPAWYHRIPIALKLKEDKPDLHAIVERVQNEFGIKPSAKFGLAVDALLEQEYEAKATKIQ